MKTLPRPALPLLALAAALLAIAGCAEKNVQVNASSDSRTAFENPVERPGVSMSGATLPEESSRPPFISLSSYDWDYHDWLEEFTEAIGTLRLPDSEEVSVQLIFRPDQDEPETSIDCADLSAADCELLRAEIDNLRGLPKLPEHEDANDLREPGKLPVEDRTNNLRELVVTLSRLP